MKKLYILWDDINPKIVKDEMENFTHIINKDNKVFGRHIQVLFKGKVIKVYSKKFSIKLLRKLSAKKYFTVICTKSERFNPLSKKGLDVYRITGDDERSSIYSTILSVLAPYISEETCKKIIGRK